MQEIDSMGNEKNGFLFKMVQENIFKDLLFNISIKSWDRII